MLALLLLLLVLAIQGEQNGRRPITKIACLSSIAFGTSWFSDGQFYCLSLTGWLGVFDPKELTWSVLVVPPLRCPENFFTKNWWKGKFLAEHDGDILVIYTCCNDYPIIFKLDQANMVWEEVKTLDGTTLFASFLSSHSRTDLPGIMRKIVFIFQRFVSMRNDAFHTP